MKLKFSFLSVLVVMALMPAVSCAGEEVANWGASQYTVDGIRYAVISEQKGYVEVVADEDNAYSGNMTIPQEVTFNGKTYKVKAIGKNAFANSAVTFLNIHKDIERFDDFAFYNCAQLEKIRIVENMVQVGGYWVEDDVYAKFVAFPESLVEIGANAFSGTHFKKIELPAGLETIGKGAFSGCTDLQAISCKAATPAQCGADCFDASIYASMRLYVPEGSVDEYRKATGWSSLENIVVYSSSAFVWDLTDKEID